MVCVLNSSVEEVGAVRCRLRLGGLASCVVTALWPQKVAGLVSLASYDIINLVEQQQARRRPYSSCDGCLLLNVHL